MSQTLDSLDLLPGETTTMSTTNRTIHYLITREKHDDHTSYLDIFDNLYSLKNSALANEYKHIALSPLNLTNNQLQWEIIEDMLLELFNDTPIKIILCEAQLDNKKSNLIGTIKNTYNKITEPKVTTHNNNIKFLEVFQKYQVGENVVSNGDCRIFSLVNAINDNRDRKIVSLASVLQLLEIKRLFSYWWHDDQLAGIGNYFGFDCYIYSDKTKLGYVYGSGTRPPIVLYHLNNETHWCPGTLIKGIKKSNKIPKDIIHTINFLAIEDIKKRCHYELKLAQRDIDLISINTINSLEKEKNFDNEGTPITISDHLNNNQHNDTVKLLKQYIHRFSTDTTQIKPAKIQPCQIKIKPNSKEPKFNPPHRVSPSQRQELKTQLDKLIQANIVKHTKSNFASPAFLVRKKEKNT